MEIDKARMKDEYLSGDYDSFFKDAAEVTGYLLNKKYYTSIEPEERNDVLQDCMVSLWEKHLDNKINTDKGDLMAFVWKNSTYKILDYLKKKNRREKIAYFFSYEEVMSDNAYCKKHKEEMCDEDY